MLKLAYNTTDTTIVVDDQGFAIGGHTWGAIDTTDPLGSAELDAKRVILADEEAAAASDNPLALAGLKHLEQRREHLAAAKALSKDELVEALDPDVVAGLDVGGDGLPHKDDLVDAVAAGDEVPEAKKPTTTPRRGR